jgi:hypothetical protein
MEVKTLTSFTRAELYYIFCTLAERDIDEKYRNEIMSKLKIPLNLYKSNSRKTFFVGI